METFPYAEYKVQDIVIHENYKNPNLHNDIALLFLESPVKIAENINTVCLPPQDYNFHGKRCFATGERCVKVGFLIDNRLSFQGWGKDTFGKEGKYQNILKKINVPIVPFGKCQDELRLTRLSKRFVLDKSFLCAGGEANDACKGDGGGPLMCEVDGHYLQAGVSGAAF
jgi:kallikrein